MPEVRVEIDDYQFHSCLCHNSWKLNNFWQLFEMYQSFEKGIMPESGGYLEQASKNLDIIRLIRELETERQIELAEKQQKKQG